MLCISLSLLPPLLTPHPIRCDADINPVIFISGFLLWNLDNIFCHSLTSAKRYIGMPWSFMLELHGWWHIFTGVGAYIFIALVEYLTSEEAGRPLGKGFAWPVGRIVSCEVGAGGRGKDGSGGYVDVNGDAKVNGNGKSKSF